MKIVINKCSQSGYWYNSQIGFTYDVISEDEHDFKVKITSGRHIGHDGYILKEDCTILSKDNKKPTWAGSSLRFKFY